MNMKKIIFLLLAAAVCCMLAACSSGNESELLTEETVGAVEQDSEKWAEISDMLGMLTVDSTEIPEFDSMKESTNLFRDSLLNYLCCKNYRKYAGNSALIDSVEEDHAGFNAIAVITKTEFESEMYRAFGGKVKLTHESTELFTYLESSEVYVPVTAPIEGGVDLQLVSAEETENTYRIEFTCGADEKLSTYFAMLIKREDGSMYFSMLLRK